jgi:hypothetical protein
VKYVVIILIDLKTITIHISINYENYCPLPYEKNYVVLIFKCFLV